MDKGHIFILQYIKNLEDQLLGDNYRVAEPLIRGSSKKVKSLLDMLYHSLDLHDEASDGYNAVSLSIPEQKYGLEWMEADGQFQNAGNTYDC